MGQTHREARRKKQEALHHDLRNALELIEHLQYAPEAKAQAMLRGLREGGGLETLLEAVRTPTPDAIISTPEKVLVEYNTRTSPAGSLAFVLNNEDVS